MEFNALTRQKQIYTKGVAAKKPLIPLDFPGLEAAAQKKLSTEAYSYLAGGAGLESTANANRAAWDKYQVVPKMLQDVSARNIEACFMGLNIPLPIFSCPIGVLELAHPSADLGVARACSALGMPMMVSSQASVPMESIAKTLNGSPWYFQLYVSKSDALVKSFIQRAEQAGAKGIVITLDTTLLGWRYRDLNLGFLPFLQGKGIAQYTSDPIFQGLVDQSTEEKDKKDINLHIIQHLIKMSNRIPGRFSDNLKGKALKTVRTFTQIYSRPDLNWKIIDQIKASTTLPVILKGIQHRDDALKTLEHGLDGIYVSNHGGRQVDGAIGSLDALAAISQVINKKIPILFDSGVRCGADVMKALALGADMIGIGRPYAYALALNGAEGVIEFIQNLAADLELNMALSGISEIAQLNKKIFDL